MNTKESRQAAKTTAHERDGWRCVACGVSGDSESLDAHHLIERKLWSEDEQDGYLTANLVSLCESCHRKAEQTLISVEELREMAGIAEIVVPEQFYEDASMTKWGDEILTGGRRLRGPLFDDESVQEILREGGMLDRYTTRVKYPRTYHMPDSPGRTAKNERCWHDYSNFEGKEVVVWLKQDGQGLAFYNDYLHARSLSEPHHPSQNYAKQFWSAMKHNIPDGWRLSIENLWAKHNIHYHNLRHYLSLFAIWNEKNFALSHDDLCEWAKLLEVPMGVVLWRGMWDTDFVINLAQEVVNNGFEGDPAEGIVAWNAESFHYRDFHKNVAKYVRANWSGEIQHGRHWQSGPIVKNELRKEKFQ